MAARWTSVDDYVASFPEDLAQALETVRRTLHEAVPGAEERISYDMPTLTLDGRPVVHFACWKRHLSLYPAPEASDDPALDNELDSYRAGRGTLRFPLDRPVPYELLGRAAAALERERRD